jgi:glucose-6-phosphate 1-dehydrogenase
MPTAPPCAIVIFGASGDLAKRKLLPAIYDMAADKLLDDKTYIVGYSRSPMTDEQYRKVARESVQKHARNKAIDENLWKSLEQRIYYTQADYGSADDHSRCAATLNRLDKKFGTPCNRLFYLSTPPEAFDDIITRLGERELAGKGQNDDPAVWHRIIIEKPFGHELASAKALNALLHKYFTEDQVFRIDHYLGKETVQNLMVMRFANSVFEPIWNYKYIDHVQITVSETLGVGTRAGYYDKSGALRDMVQNHMFQLMALVAMEPPAALDAVSIRDEKVKVFKSARRIRPEQVEQFAVRGQYGAGEVDGQKTQGYLKEKDVPGDSRTETFAALKVFIDNWRWSGMPFYLRTGKFLPQKLSEVVVRFRSPPLTLFQKQCESPVYPNDLIIRVQPAEGISWRLNGKVPGGQLNIKSVALDFLYETTFNVEPPEAYERLIFDAMAGDQTLFIRGDETEAAWAVIDPIEQGWAKSKQPPQQYAPGSWGPKRAMDLIELDGRRWLHSTDGEREPIIACSL